MRYNPIFGSKKAKKRVAARGNEVLNEVGFDEIFLEEWIGAQDRRG
ncbi:hypothetical protein AGMMS49992_05550 [Clostridia bacterium]|nr:hypothetical protein AGMMS49992_05550 [Clostridia bacterium]